MTILRRRLVRLTWLTSALLVLLTCTPGANAQDPWDWWPDPSTRSGLAVWIPFSRDYNTWMDHGYIDRQMPLMQQLHVDVVFVAISDMPPERHLERLSMVDDPFTVDVQYLLNQLILNGIRASAAILSDDFRGTDSDMARYVRVDHIMDFNQNRGPDDAGFTSVATDLEMPRCDMIGCYRTTEVYDKWKQFQLNLKNRIASRVRYVIWTTAPDAMMDRMSYPDDRRALMCREHMSFDGSDTHGNLYNGAVKYFTTQDGVALADAVVPQWYFRDFDPYRFRLDHNINELQSLEGDKPFMIGGVKINDGVCRADCLQTEDAYLNVLSYNDDVRMTFTSFIGTGVFKWPYPVDWTGGTVPAGVARFKRLEKSR